MAGTLLERAAERELLAAFVRGASAGSGAALLIEGEAGIGKSALLRAGESIAREQNLRVLTACGGELESEFAYGVARQLLEGELARASAARRAKLLAGAAALAAPIIAPTAAEGFSPQPPPDAFALQHGLYWLVENLSVERPLALVVDDVQWADAATLRFLVYLAHRLEGMPVALVVASRLGAPGTHTALINSLRSQASVASVDLRPLSERAVATLAAEVLDGSDPAFTRACHEVTGGNPFLVHELLRTLAADGVAPTAASVERVRKVGPTAVSRSVLMRLSRLSPAAVTLAQAVSVLGGRTALGHAAALAGLSEETAQHAADALAEARILAPSRPLEFHHPLVRAAIYEDLPAGRRAADHRRAGRLLATDAPAERVASHLLATEPAHDEWVVDLLREAADAALARGAPDAAADYLRRAVAEPPPPPQRATLLHRLGSAEARAGEPGAIDHLAAAVELADDPRAAASAALELANALLFAGRVGEGVRVLEEAATRLGDGDRELSLRLQADVIALAEYDVGLAGIAAERLEGVVGSLPGNSPAERLLLAHLAHAKMRGGADPVELMQLAERALADGRLLAEQTADSPSFYHVAEVLYSSGERFDWARELVEAAFADARKRGSVAGFVIASCFSSDVAYRIGALREAEADARGALEAAREHEWGVGIVAGVIHAVKALTARGDLRGAEALLAGSGIDLGAATPLLAELVYARGRLRLAEGRFEEALEDVHAAAELAEAQGARNPAGRIAWRSSAAEALTGLGRGEKARRLAQEELGLVRRWGRGRAAGIALRVLGVATEGDEGGDLLREAVETLAQTAARYEHARALTDLGARLRRAGRRSEAREPLAEAVDLAHRCGAGALLIRAREELAATGARPRRFARWGVDALTPSERRICGLAAQGLSNPEIAQALFVTRATVESHLHSAYRKLEIGSRKQLAGALAPVGESEAHANA
jgi:DNA-binding CsgD family transcriptional regulator